MRKITHILMLLLLIPELWAVTHVTSKEIRLQGGYDVVLEAHVDTITSQNLTQFSGMPFDIFDPYVQFRLGADNPSNGERIIARWDLISNSDFKLEINAKPLKHVSIDSRPLYYRLAFNFNLSYMTTSGIPSTVNGYYVFIPNENATDGSGETLVQVNGRNINGSPSFSQIVSDYWAMQDTYIGAVHNDVFFGFTNATSSFLLTPEAQELPDGNYTAEVTITLTAL